MKVIDIYLCGHVQKETEESGPGTSRSNSGAAESYYHLLSELAPDHPELPELKKRIDIRSLMDVFSKLTANTRKREERRAKRKKRAPKPKKKGDPDQEDLLEP